MNRPDDIPSRLTRVMQSDRFRLHRMLRQMQNATRDDTGGAAQWQDFETRLSKSEQLWQERARRVPDLTIPAELPIHEHVDEIKEALANHQVLVVCGETGSGKSTQLPKICLAAGRGVAGMIGHTQPRRLAARSIAARLIEELQTSLGDTVGYKIRFTDHTAPHTLIKLMTDGILLAETQSDRFLDNYDTLIVDEAHERSLNIDFLIGYLRRLLENRPDLKVILTSATLDAAKFASHFAMHGNPAPVIEVAGRTYPVELRYRPLIADDEVAEADAGERDLLAGLVDSLQELQREGPGDTLVFLPTEAEIRAATKRLRSVFAAQTHRGELEILPLYARLSNKDQNRVFQPGHARRIVLATNVAESSLTVPGIRFVVDAGTARISRYAPRTKVQRLPIEPVSQASADQRAGRCGRLGPGICIRLYAQSDYETRERYSTPEIRRTNLAAVILQTEALRLGKISEFPFIDPPRPESIRDGFKTLFELGAVDQHHRLTKLGRQLSRLPVDPRVGRMILAANELSCLADMLILASGLEIQDPRERPAEKQQAADQQHQKFQDESSDFMSLLNVWDFYHDLKEKLSQSQLRKACHQNFLSYNRLREWADLHRQLHSIVQQAKMHPGLRSRNYDAIHRALLSGLLSGVAYRSDKYEYTGAGGLKFHLWPGSGLFEKRPEWILVNEIVETTRRYGRTAARLQVDWIEPIAEHLIKRSHSDGHWSQRAQRPMALERVTLFGLPIVVKRRVPLGLHDPQQARRIFIDEGLVEHRYTDKILPLQANLKLLDHLSEQAARRRAPERMIDPYRVIQWYDERIPDSVFDGGSLKRAIQSDVSLPQQLTMSESDFFPDPPTEDAEQFPAELELGSLHLPLDYVFEPGSEADGVTLTIPVEGLNQISSRQLGWLVPGLLQQRIVALIRSLPKSIRRQLVPAPDTAKRILPALRFGEGDFYESVAAALSQIAGEKIAIEEFRLDKLPEHLNMNLRVVDERGATLATGRNLDQIRLACGVDATGYTSIDDAQWTRDGIQEWDFDELPKSVSLTRNQLEVLAYPALIDRQDTVSLKLVDLPETADALTRVALARLASWRSRKSLRSQVKWMPNREQWLLWGRGIVTAEDFETDLAMLLARMAFVDRQKIPRQREDWEQRFTNEVERIGIATQDAMRALPKLFQAYHRVRLLMEGQKLSADSFPGDDLHHQLTELFPRHFLLLTPWQWLQHLPRYLQAMEVRLERLPGNLARDRELAEAIQPFQQRYTTRRDKHQLDGIIDPALEEFRWLLEEYRVSLWAQQLGTSAKVSPQRLEKQWTKVRE